MEVKGSVKVEGILEVKEKRESGVKHCSIVEHGSEETCETKAKHCSEIEGDWSKKTWSHSMSPLRRSKGKRGNEGKRESEGKRGNEGKA